MLCSGDLVLTVLWRETFNCAFNLVILFSINVILSDALPGSWSLCTNTKRNRETCGALPHICLTVQNYGRQTGSELWAGGERGRKRARGPPASCPGFVYNKKPLFDVVAQPAPKLKLPQDVLWVKCQTEATAGWLQPHHAATLSKVLLRPLETIKHQQFDAFWICIY